VANAPFWNKSWAVAKEFRRNCQEVTATPKGKRLSAGPRRADRGGAGGTCGMTCKPIARPKNCGYNAPQGIATIKGMTTWVGPHVLDIPRC